ncbi:hypothetical protein JXM83_06910 [Candidatus Woesearchaeota archaeon]|nr:hypothetical protein [Candidatus Woesearchaeota archaeon]
MGFKQIYNILKYQYLELRVLGLIMGLTIFIIKKYTENISYSKSLILSLIIVTIIFLLFTEYKIHLIKNLKKTGIKISSIVSYSRGWGIYQYFKYTYIVNYKKYTKEIFIRKNNSLAKKFLKTEKIKVLYNPNNPRESIPEFLSKEI